MGTRERVCCFTMRADGRGKMRKAEWKSRRDVERADDERARANERYINIYTHTHTHRKIKKKNINRAINTHINITPSRDALSKSVERK